MNGKAVKHISEFMTKALQAAKVYKEATGIECFVINNKGEKITLDGIEVQGCPFSFKQNQVCASEENCRRSHLYGGYQAERFGGNYIYFCPDNMLHWASPLMEEGLMIGALIAGPALIIDPDEFVDDLKSKFNLSIDDLIELRARMKQVPLLTTSRAKALSEMLFITASHLLEKDQTSLVSKKEDMDQQSQISTYIHYIKQMEEKDSDISRYPVDKEKDLLHLIQTGDSKEARKVLNEILGTVFFSSGGNFVIIKTRILELLILLSRAAMEGGADAEQIFGMNYTYLNEINGYSTVEGLASWLDRIIVRFSDLVFDLRDVKHADAIYQTIQYVNKHYAEKVILEDAASAVYLSPAYFSKIFKEEMKCTFSNYLNQVRINKSKNLLISSKYALIEIAGMVGFEDQSYFTRVFKKITGLSPGKYREKRGKIDLENQEIHSKRNC
jgi:two-component system, response regulator YesN